MARIRITNGAFPGHTRKTLDQLGQREVGVSGNRVPCVNEATATLLNMQSRAIVATPEELFVNFMYDSLGQSRIVANGRMFEGMQTPLNVQGGLGTYRQLASPSYLQFKEFTDADLIDPKHTSEVPLDSHAGVPSASSEYDQSHYAAWRAVNGNPSAYEWASDGSAFPQWWKYDFRLPVWIKRYTIGSSENPTYMPKSWQFQGSQDNVNWTTLDTQSNVTNWVSGQYNSYTFTYGKFYRYFRLYITASNNPTYVYLGEVKLFSYPSAPEGPSLWTPFNDGTAGRTFRVGCIVPSAYAIPSGLDMAADYVATGGQSWEPITGMTLKDTRAAGKAYVGTITLSTSGIDNAVRIRSPQSSYYTVRCLAAERIP